MLCLTQTGDISVTTQNISNQWSVKIDPWLKFFNIKRTRMRVYLCMVKNWSWEASLMFSILVICARCICFLGRSILIDSPVTIVDV